MSDFLACASCVFFRPNPMQARRGGALRGQCRRFAPSLDQSDGHPRTLWPLVNEGDWCGDHATPAEE